MKHCSTFHQKERPIPTTSFPTSTITDIIQAAGALFQAPDSAMSTPEMELQNASLQAAGRSGSNPWQLFLYFIFPIPLVFLVLISLPFPARYRAKIRVGILVRLMGPYDCL